MSRNPLKNFNWSRPFGAIDVVAIAIFIALASWIVLRPDSPPDQTRPSQIKSVLIEKGIDEGRVDCMLPILEEELDASQLQAVLDRATDMRKNTASEYPAAALERLLEIDNPEVTSVLGRFSATCGFYVVCLPTEGNLCDV